MYIKNIVKSYLKSSCWHSLAMHTRKTNLQMIICKIIITYNLNGYYTVI